MRIIRQKSGITLIALIITIIVLLILAGISITQLTGSGLFGKVLFAKNKTIDAEEDENLKLGEYENELGSLLGETRGGNCNGILGVKGTQGDGTKNNPYIITTAEQLQVLKIIKDTTNMHIKLGNDIDLIEECSKSKGNWIPIGTESNPFKGEFDGNGKTISNLFIENGNEKMALFQYNEGTIKNLNVQGSITNTKDCAGIVYENRGIIENCTNYVTISLIGNRGSGGVVRMNYNVIRRCINKANLTSNKTNPAGAIGGVVSFNGDNGIVEECINEGVIEGYTELGGIVSYNVEGKVKSCINKGQIKGTLLIAGVVSYLYSNGQIYNSYNIANISGTTHVGGIVGQSGLSNGGKGYIYNCYSINRANIVGTTVNSSPSVNCYTSGMTAENLNNGVDDITTNENTESPWREDVEPNINGGYPILKWLVEK